MSEQIAGNNRPFENIRGRIRLDQPLPQGGLVRLFLDQPGPARVLAEEDIGPDGLFGLRYQPTNDPGDLRIEVFASDEAEPLLSHAIPPIPERDFLEISAEGLQRLKPSDMFTPTPTVYWRDTYPIDAKQVQISQDATLQAYRAFDEGSRDIRNLSTPYPWRYQVNPSTRLPTLMRRRVNVPLDAEVRSKNFTSALFGVDLSSDFDRHFLPQAPIQMAVETGSRGLEENTHSTWQQIFQTADGTVYPVLGGSFRVHGKTGMNAVAVTNSYFPVQADELFPAPKVSDEDLFDVALKSLFFSSADSHTLFLDALKEFRLERGTSLIQRLLSNLTAFLRIRRKREIAEKTRVPFRLKRANGKEKKYPLAILPYAGRYYLVARVRVQAGDEDAWYMDIDIHARQVVGVAWQLVAGAPYFSSSDDAIAENPTGQFPSAKLGIQNEPLPPLLKIPNVPETERTTVAVHGQRFFTHLVVNCGAEPQLRQFVEKNYQFDIILESSKSSKFVYDPSIEPKQIHLEGDRVGSIRPSSDGKPIFHPGWDPELIVHELAHAFFWLLNKDPWETPATIAPFSRALHEGYAVYLARSLAAADEDEPEDKSWASGAYRTADWKDRWQLQRSRRIVGADLLRKPNNYPVRNFHKGQQNIDWEDYDVGMIWARALWDLRQLLGPIRTDYLAVQSYLYLHGAIVNLQTAAEAIIDAGTSRSPGNLAAAVEPIWSTRGLTSDVGVFGITTGPNAQLFAGSEKGIWVRNGNGWMVDPASMGNVKLASIESLASLGNRLFAIATPPRGNESKGVSAWNAGLFVRENGVWRSHPVPDGVTPLGVFGLAGALLLATAGGVYIQGSGGVWQPIGDKSTQIGELSHWVDANSQGWLIAGLPQHIAWIEFPLLANAKWASVRMPEDGRPSALVVWQKRQYVGTLERGIWQYTGKALVQTDFVPPDSAVLALAASNTQLVWSTPEEVGWSDGNNHHRVAPPCAAGIVVSLWVDENETLFAGTLAHGIWRLVLTDAVPTWTAEHLSAGSMQLTIGAGAEVLLSYFHRRTNPAAPLVDVADAITIEAVAQPGFPLQKRIPDPQRQVFIEAGWVILRVRSHLIAPVQIEAHSDDSGRVIVERV